MLNKLVIATNNEGKLLYFNNLLGDLDLEILSLKDFQKFSEPLEDGKTEKENAVIKAKYYSKKINEVCLSDDTGLYIPALNNEPGVQARRWGGNFPADISDEDWLNYFLDRMKNVHGDDREGEFRVARAIVCPDGQEFTICWRREILINEKPDWTKYKKGLPLGTLSIEKKFKKSWQDLTFEELREYEKENILKFKKIFNKIWKKRVQ